jgi:hypothetical protein
MFMVLMDQMLPSVLSQKFAESTNLSKSAPGKARGRRGLSARKDEQRRMAPISADLFSELLTQDTSLAKFAKPPLGHPLKVKNLCRKGLLKSPINVT